MVPTGVNERDPMEFELAGIVHAIGANTGAYLARAYQTYERRVYRHLETGLITAFVDELVREERRNMKLLLAGGNSRQRREVETYFECDIVHWEQGLDPTTDFPESVDGVVCWLKHINHNTSGLAKRGAKKYRIPFNEAWSTRELLLAVEEMGFALRDDGTGKPLLWGRQDHPRYEGKHESQLLKEQNERLSKKVAEQSRVIESLTEKLKQREDLLRDERELRMKAEKSVRRVKRLLSDDD